MSCLFSEDSVATQPRTMTTRHNGTQPQNNTIEPTIAWLDNSPDPLVPARKARRVADAGSSRCSKLLRHRAARLRADGQAIIGPAGVFEQLFVEPSAHRCGVIRDHE